MASHPATMTHERIAEIDAMAAQVVIRARPILAVAPPHLRAKFIKQQRDWLENVYAVMLGQAGPNSEEAIFIVEKVREALEEVWGAS